MNQHRFSFVCCIIIVLSIAACGPSKTQLKKQQQIEQAEALRKLGEVYMTENKDTAAFKKFMEAEKLNPKDPYIHFDLGIFYYNKGKYDLAIERYEKCLELKPSFASVRNNLGLAYMAKGEYDTAISYFNELTDNYLYATPHYPLCNLGQAYYHKRQYDVAEEYLKEAISMQPDFAIALHWLGRTQIKLGKASDAVKTWKRLSVWRRL